MTRVRRLCSACAFRPGGGIEDGYQVIDILVRHPSTARFHFAILGDALRLRRSSAGAGGSHGGDVSRERMATCEEVMRTMMESPEFWAESAYRAKIKSPFEMVVSALRATNANIDFTNALANQLNHLGEPLYRKVEPTGYSNRNAEWMNSAALLGRMNFALSLAANKLAGVKLTSAGDERCRTRWRGILIGSRLDARIRGNSWRRVSTDSAGARRPNSMPALDGGVDSGFPGFSTPLAGRLSYGKQPPHFSTQFRPCNGGDGRRASVAAARGLRQGRCNRRTRRHWSPSFNAARRTA